jgi:cytochrome c peroxidase
MTLESVCASIGAPSPPTIPEELRRVCLMKRRRIVALSVMSIAAVAALVVFSHTALISQAPPPMPTTYFPYPPGIIPADINTELARVEREISFIENEAINEWHALGPVTFTGQPPIIQGTGYAAVRTLGKLMNFDLRMSPFQNIACASCHMPYAGFSGPIPSVNLTMIGYPGSFHFRAGKRNPQRYTYSPRFPVLHQDAKTLIGGNFWDGRATGYLLQNPDAEQSQHPPVDTQEHMFPDIACVPFRLSTAVYRPLFEQIWGAGSLTINFPANTAQICATPGGAAAFGSNTEPVQLSPTDRTRARDAYNHWAQSISFYESGPDVSPLSSKFDAFLAGRVQFTPDELAGYELFKGKGNCNSCHLDGRSTTLKPGQTDNGNTADIAPILTCFGFANLGLPKNPRDAFLFQTTPDFFGFTANPEGFAYTDFGLGQFLRSGFGAGPDPNSAFALLSAPNDGKFQTSTARDVAMTPPQCPTTEAPGPYFQKQFFHNGYIKSLKQLVHFYNTRDRFRMAVQSGECPSGTIEKVNCWPAAEVPQNQDMTVGNLGLTDQEENQIVIFLQTLNDGFTTPLPDINTFTGTCMSGGNASTQGNSVLIPFPKAAP